MATGPADLRRWREGAGEGGAPITQEAAAARIGVAQGLYSEWEAGKKTPRIDGLLKIQRATGIEPGAFAVEQPSP